MNTSFPHHIFKAYDIRGKVGSELTPNLCMSVGKATAQWLPVAGAVAVGYDMRPDSQELAEAVISGLRDQGRDVIVIGQVTSDMIYFAIGHYDLAGGLMITASHNPGEYNGVKIYRDKVTPVGLDSGLSEIRNLAEGGSFNTATQIGTLKNQSITAEWVAHALSQVDASSWPEFRIAVDTGNGMAGAIMPDVLAQLPMITSKNMYFELDGTFPNHGANPQDTETLNDLVEAVVSDSLDFGIAFDGDGDRAGFVDDLGRPVLGTDLISIVARLALSKNPGSTIVHDVRTSKATTELIREWGGVPLRTKAGRVFIGAKLREVGGSFGGETTGHLFFAGNFDADSGLITALSVVQAVAESGKKLSELVDEYRRYAMPPEINYSVADKAVVFEELKRTYSDCAFDELDGLTVTSGEFWFNLRASNTEPLVRLNIEANDDVILHEELAKIEHIISKESK